MSTLTDAERAEIEIEEQHEREAIAKRRAALIRAEARAMVAEALSAADEIERVNGLYARSGAQIIQFKKRG